MKFVDTEGKMGRLKVALILIAIGFAFIVLDIPVASNIPYPNKYENTNQVIGEYQYYNIASNYGATCTYKVVERDKGQKAKTTNSPNVKVATTPVKVIDKVFFKSIQIDVLEDVIGFLSILIGCALIVKCSKRFKLAILCAVAGIIVHGIMFSLPFIINGILLTNASFFIGMIYLAINIATIFFTTTALLKMIPGPWCRDERKWGKILWYATFASQTVATFAFWLGSDFTYLKNVAWAAFIITIILQLAFWRVFNRAKDYARETYEKFYIENN